MTLARFLVEEGLPDGVGEPVELRGDEGRHAAVVRRIRAGERVELGDGRGRVLTATVLAATRDGLRCTVEAVRDEPAPSPSFVVVQALAKGERGELAVELLTELGADVVVPWAAARSVARWDAARATRGLARWRSSAREAAKQSRRAWLPEVAEPASAADVVERLRAASLALVLHEEAATALPGLEPPPAGDVVLVVGPEGGLAPEELAAFTAAGATAVRLGGPVLRTSTAGAAALAVLSAARRWR